MKRILVVEDSSMITKVLRHVIDQEIDIDATYVSSFAQATFAYKQMKENLFAALVDLNLPDAPNGEVVNFMLERKIPTIVLTASFDEEKRKALLMKGVVDYITKEGNYSYQYAVNLIHRLDKNKHIKVLVVDDSLTQKAFISKLLSQHMFQILVANDGIEAIEVLLKNPDIKLLITDYNMPKMDGFELVKNLRHKYEKSDLVIIGLSGEGDSILSAKFIKNGANDFLHKPFSHEEFYCRVTANVEMLELIEKIRDSANRDYLTDVFNRRHFFQVGDELYKQACLEQTPIASVMIDIDNFKQINDTYGHSAGDEVLKEVGRALSELLEDFLVARAGGEEFFVLLPGIDNGEALALIDKVRQNVSDNPVSMRGQEIHVTFSAGVSNAMEDSLYEQINRADYLLYRAKETGRNRVLGDDYEEKMKKRG